MKRRGFSIILILVIVAAVLTGVFINLFKEKDTKALAENLNSYVGRENGYLNAENENYKIIDEYLSSVSTNLTAVEEKNETKNYQMSYRTFVVAGEFFNREMVYTEFTNVYKDNRKKIQENFSKGQECAKKLAKFIEENKEITGGSAYWEANTWTNCKDYMKNLFNYTMNAFTRLDNVYEASVPSKILNNELTSLIFETFDELAEKTITDLRTDSDCGTNLYNFTNNYMTKSKESIILRFNYNTTAQENVKTIKEKANGWEAKYNSFLAGNIEA